ncbi:MAG: fimbrillin family protein [Tidjanibacter sp.]|nr:fimbrillin family protein [Tidjanibacter sp.]
MNTRNKIKSPLYQLALVLIGLVCFTSCVIDETDNYLPSTSKRIGFSASEVKSKSATGSRAMLSDNTPTLHLQATEGEQSLDVVTTDGINVCKGTASPATRGTQTFTTGAWDYRVVAYFYPESGNPMNFFLRHKEGIVINSDSGEYATDYYWPSMGEMEFFAVAPSSIDLPILPTKTPTISYTITNNIAKQQDVMVAHPAVVDCTEEQPAVGLQFDHLLAAVQFKVGKMLAVRINSLSISGVKGGTINMTYNPNTDSWNYSGGSNTTYNIITTTYGTPNIDTYGMTEGSYITSNDNGMTMLVMPQSLNGATVNISYTEQLTQTTHTISIPLSGTWEAGKTTTYILNIEAETLQITIPTPPDADAHYVRVDMPYSLKGLDAYLAEKGFTISNITARTEWLDFGNSSADKRDIFIKTSLTEMQSQGYFTDELWEVTYSVGSDGSKRYTVGSEAGPELTNSELLGKSTQQIANDSRGTIYLFLDENNGTTDRIGKLELTATIRGNGSSRTITLATGTFKQLCPSWNSNGLGVERFEDDTAHPYGFSYNRKVIYTNPDLEGKTEWDDFSFLEKLFLILRLLFTGSITNEVLPDMSGADAAVGFVTIEKLQDMDMVKSITLDYGALNDVHNHAGKEYDGLANTTALYNYTGAIDLTGLEPKLDTAMVQDQNWEKNILIENEDDYAGYYAAFEALTRNRMRELRTTITTSEGSEIITKTILHKENEGNGIGGINETGADIIEWYLPSIGEAKTLKETGTGSENTPISPLHGTYWSSTSGSDPESGSNGFAYSYTYTDNSYTNYNAQQDRTSELKVRAVRKR